MVDFTQLSRIDRALIDALDRLGGVASEPEMEQAAASRGENGLHGTHGHFAKNSRGLVDKGILTVVVVGAPLWCFTDDAWVALGHQAPAPRPRQEALFA